MFPDEMLVVIDATGRDLEGKCVVFAIIIEGWDDWSVLSLLTELE